MKSKEIHCDIFYGNPALEVDARVDKGIVTLSTDYTISVDSLPRNPDAITRMRRAVAHSIAHYIANRGLTLYSVDFSDDRCYHVSASTRIREDAFDFNPIHASILVAYGSDEYASGDYIREYFVARLSDYLFVRRSIEYKWSMGRNCQSDRAYKHTIHVMPYPRRSHASLEMQLRSMEEYRKNAEAENECRYQTCIGKQGYS